MKKIILSLCLVLSTTAYAGGNHGGTYGGSRSYSNHSTTVINNNYHGGYRGGYWRNGGWVAPLVVGGVIGTAIAAPYVYSTPVYAPPAVVEVVPVPAPVYTNTVQTNNTCAYPFTPTYNRIHTTDRFGNNIQVDQFVGCR